MQCNMSDATYATNVMKHEYAKYRAMQPIMQTTWQYDKYTTLQCNLNKQLCKVIGMQQCINYKDATII